MQVLAVLVICQRVDFAAFRVLWLWCVNRICKFLEAQSPVKFESRLRHCYAGPVQPLDHFRLNEDFCHGLLKAE
jgi:hypothetical protein